ncbi:MAG: hypothetical protein CL942_13085 [Desulfovibrio sp.]|nr:hypothetical protein [Desulfovibrio sp.]|tara:strand:+ start:72371 stop:73543 length:1173 start_codon:yes stop_codon:yes gene_type:complete
MLYFLGNCQADFVSKSMERLGHQCSYGVQASPLTYPSHPGSVPAWLQQAEQRFGLTDYLHGRLFTNQFEPVPNDTQPQLIVLSLFHENTPLFVHNDDEYVFFMDTNALNSSPELMQWASANCRMFKPDPKTYLSRYEAMVSQLSHAHPDVPILILNRLSHYSAFGPEPFSYLEGWEHIWPKAETTLNQWAETLDNVHILDMNRIFGGIWAKSENGISSLCPFLKLTLEEKDGQVIGLHARRDIEHIAPMPDLLARKIEIFLEHGSIQYNTSEVVPTEWRRSPRLQLPDDNKLSELLHSGANYRSGEAVAAFFLNLGRDYTDLLVEARHHMPVCHMTLHMIKAYARIHQNPKLAQWCETHRTIAEQFTANGPLYQRDYLNRIDEIVADVTR